MVSVPVYFRSELQYWFWPDLGPGSGLILSLSIDALRIIVSLAVCDSAHNTGGVTVKILSTENIDIVLECPV